MGGHLATIDSQQENDFIHEQFASEHVVWLAPRVEGERLLPRAEIEVWAWQGSTRQDRSWTRTLGSPLAVEYDRFDREP